MIDGIHGEPDRHQEDRGPEGWGPEDWAPEDWAPEDWAPEDWVPAAPILTIAAAHVSSRLSLATKQTAGT